jgi:Uma2 family endonuclease
MNLAAQENLAISHQEYQEGEQLSDIRHEYLAGQVFAMAGAGEKHNRIAGNLFFHLRAAARGKPCGVFISDMKLRVEQNDAYYYPDVMVTCDPEDSELLHKRLPCLIVEVLSPATEAIDRREKLIAYRSLPSLRYYLLVSQEKRQVECYARAADGRWLITVVDNEGVLEFICDDLKASFSLDDIYEDVRL